MIRKAIRIVKGDSLYINSFFNMAGTIATAALGFLFWLISAHLYSPEEIGLAASLIAAVGFISYLSLLGFNTTFIRFLPNSKRRNAEINTGLILVFCAAIITSLGYVLLVPVLAPELGFVRDSWAYAIGFIALSAIASVNFLTDSVFVAFRSAKYNLIVYAIMGISKLALPVVFLGLGAYGLFGAAGAAGVIGLLLSVYFMRKLFGYRAQLKINKATLKEVFSFSFGNYVANLLNILPTLVIPFIIINQLGAAANGYYYLAFMVINLVYAVSYAVTQSLLAEGSYADKPFGPLLKRTALILSGIMLPATAFFAIAGPWVLGIFGEDYSLAGGEAMIILGLAAPFVALYVMSVTALQVARKTLGLVALNAIYAGLIIGLVFAWIANGLPGVAWAWLIGHGVAGVIGLAIFTWPQPRTARTSPHRS